MIKELASHFLVVVLVLACACSSGGDPTPNDPDEEPEPEPNPEEPIYTSCRITQLTGGPVTLKYNYSTEGLMTSFDFKFESQTVTINIEYDESDRVTKITSSENRYLTVKYLGNGDIIETMYTRDDASEEFSKRVHRFEFDDGLLERKEDTLNVADYIRYEHDSEGNVSKVYSTNFGHSPEALREEYISWDDKKANELPFKAIILNRSPRTPELYAELDPAPHKHNYLHYKSHAQFVTSEYFYTYTYNSLGYPKKIVSNSLTTNYQYACE